ncbi:MAG: hypothetical protein ACYCZ7_02025 [Minisyncoccota bacterium]
MDTIRLFPVFVLVFGVLLVSDPSYADKKLTDKERRERANTEYARCMAVAREEGIPAMFAYIRKEQKGSSLKGSPEKLAQENCAADGIGLMRYQDLSEIIADQKKLTPLSSPLVKIKNVPQARSVACSWTCRYIVELATYAKKASDVKTNPKLEPSLVVTSLVRSRTVQDEISKVSKFYRRIKGKIRRFTAGGRSFADCSTKAICSTHLTGSTFDISLLGVDKKKRKILAERLCEDRENGRILAILESAGNHFHVFVIPPQYVPIQTPTP